MTIKTTPFEDNLEFTYSVCAVVFGADESLLKIHLHDGFSFQKRSLNPNVDNLNEVFDTSSIGLRREYESARLDQESLDVICAVKYKSYRRPVVNFQDCYYDDSDLDLVTLDNQIRVIRLIKECPLRFKKIAFHLSSERYYLNDETSSAVKKNEIVTIPEAVNTQTDLRFHFSDEEVERINRALSEINFPLTDKLLNSCHGYYDLSYHTEKSISITLLITALEILFLKKDAQNKKEMLAKRCAVFLYDGDEQIKNTYSVVKELYKKRSVFVHEGKASAITEEDIITLRSFVRDALLKALSFSENKNQRIVRVKQLVTEYKELFGE